MKKLNLEEMEIVQGGGYCDTLWILMTEGGYQGDWAWLFDTYRTHCLPNQQ
jgi:hypothetical protein